MICTTLIPSYKRAALLVIAIASFRKSAAKPDQHQVIVRMSENDPDAERMFKALPIMFDNCRVIVGPHGGYTAIGDYYTEMLPYVEGDWINIWDDDMAIEGEKWDEKLAESPKSAMVICENYQLGPSWYGRGSLDGAATGWFAHFATWKATGETAIGFPPDTYMRRLAQRMNWPIHYLSGITLNHNWQRPTDGDR